MESTVAAALSNLGREALRIVLPSWCAACGRELPWRHRTASCCRECWDALPRIDGVRCVSCALPLPGGSGQPLCLDCQLDPLPLQWCTAWGRYSGTLEALLGAFKFRHHDFLDGAFAALLEEALLDRDFDALVPVPMHRTKERRRGYNQAELLARALAKRIGIPCEMLLTKREERETQSTLDRAARAANVRGLFEASPRASGRAILLIDDICTTGETLRACATELLRRGAARVSAITVAKAI